MRCLRRNLVAAGLLLTLAGCAPVLSRRSAMSVPLSKESVTNFLVEFERLAEQENFELIREFIDEQAYFRFNDGDFIGQAAIQAVFEKTWRGDPSVKKARFYLTDITVLTIDQRTASATYTWNWEGSQGDRQFAMRGRGTRVLAFENGKFRIVHEHLSRFPRPQ
jgi:hypothetical protein